MLATVQSPQPTLCKQISELYLFHEVTEWHGKLLEWIWDACSCTKEKQ